jgi:hypothetical protein
MPSTITSLLLLSSSSSSNELFVSSSHYFYLGDPVAVLEQLIALLPGQRCKQIEYFNTFLGRDTEFRQVFDLVAANFAHRNSEHKNSHIFVLVPGGPGIGKTRFSHELQYRLRKFVYPGSDPALVAALQNPIYLLIDFNNGMQYVDLFDPKQTASVRMGARLFKAYFGGEKPFAAILSMAGNSLFAMEPNLILQRIIVEERKSRGADFPICIIVHVDEFQLYITRTSQAENVSLDEARNKYKDMLKQIGAFMMHNSMFEWDRNAFILPVCSGISEIDTTFLPTEYGKDVVRLPPLSRDEAMIMANEKYTADPSWPATKAQNYFQVALSDTGTILLLIHAIFIIVLEGYIPRYIEYLVNSTHCNITDWGDQLYLKVSKGYGELISHHSSKLERAALLALTAETVLFM